MTLAKVIWHTFDEWCKDTSIAGLGKAMKSDSRFKKAYWFILFLIGTIWTIINLFGVINAFFEYKVSTSNDLTFSTSISFPAVSICNQNRWSKILFILKFPSFCQLKEARKFQIIVTVPSNWDVFVCVYIWISHSWSSLFEIQKGCNF